MTIFFSRQNNARGRNQDPVTFAPHLIQAPGLLMERGRSSGGMRPLCSALCRQRIKATFLFPPNSVSIFFIQLRWAEKVKILAGNNMEILSLAKNRKISLFISILLFCILFLHFCDCQSFAPWGALWILTLGIRKHPWSSEEGPV